jgi:hypothetical protein
VADEEDETVEVDEDVALPVVETDTVALNEAVGDDDEDDVPVEEPVPVLDDELDRVVVGETVGLAEEEVEGDWSVDDDGAELCVPDAVAEGVDVGVDEAVAVTDPDAERLGVGEGELDRDALAVELPIADTDTVPLGEKVAEGEALNDENDELVADTVDEPVPVLDDELDRVVVGETVGLAEDEVEGDGKAEGDGRVEGVGIALCVPHAVADGVDVGVDEAVAVTDPDVERLSVGEGEAVPVKLAVELLVADEDTVPVAVDDEVGGAAWPAPVRASAMSARESTPS